MTTIATDGISMAGDGLVVEGDCITDTDFPKVYRVGTLIVGMAGNAYDQKAFIAWLEAGKPEDHVPHLKESTVALVLHANGCVSSFDYRGREIQEPKMAAVGSGAVYAIAAMDAGLPPAKALEVACKRDIRSGGTISVLWREGEG